MKSAALKILRATGALALLRSRFQPNALRDITGLLARTPIGTIFDVGANIGQSATAFASRFPNAKIHSFEPEAENFAALVKNTAHLKNVTCHNLALGANAGAVQIVRHASDPSMHRISEAAGSEGIQRVSVDAFCSSRAIDRIGFLKIDTEGHDLDVIRGGHNLLSGQRIDLVEAECGINPDNTLHVPFEALKSHLEGYGYRLFRIYEQVDEWPTRERHLRRINAVFMSREVIEANRY
jgi:FkbM family methyltransferase